MAVYVGRVGSITVSGQVISGSGAAGIEATVIVGKEIGKHNPVGTDVSELVRGMKTVEGTLRKAWVSGDTLFKSLLDSDLNFEVVITATGLGQSITASGCKAGSITRRVAPGTEVLIEEMPFTGRDWY